MPHLHIRINICLLPRTPDTLFTSHGKTCHYTAPSVSLQKRCLTLSSATCHQTPGMSAVNTCML